MRQYTKSQKQKGEKVWKQISEHLQPISKIDKNDECMARIADIMMRLVHNQPVNKGLTKYFYGCLGVQGIAPPHSAELNHLAKVCIDAIGHLTGNHITAQQWLCYPLVAFPVHKSGTPKTKENDNV